MKKLFLLALAAASVSMVSAQDKNSTQIFQDGHKLSVEWVNTDLVGVTNVYRAGIGAADKFFICQYEESKLYIYNEKGLDVAMDMAGMWVTPTVDQAGHVLIRLSDKNFPNVTGGTYPGCYYPSENQKLAVMNPETNEVLGYAPMKDGAVGRFDCIAPIYGDVMNGFWELTAVAGGAVGGIDFVYDGLNCSGAESFPVPVDPAFAAASPSNTTTGLAQIYGEDEDGVGQMALYGNPLLEVTSSEKGLGNGIQRYFYGYDPELDEDDEDNVQMWRPTGEFFITPQHGSNNGYYVFELCGKQYIVYTSGAGGGTNAPDAFAISEVKFTDTPLTDAELDKTVLVARLFPVTNETGSNAYKAEHQWTTFNVVPVEGEPNSVYIYTYCSGSSMIKTKFTAPEGAGIDNIVVDSNVNAPVEYYNLEGVRVANPGNGIFIQRQGNKVTKVIY